MMLGALVAAGAPLSEVSRALEALGVPFKLRAETVDAGGTRALRLVVEGEEQHTHRSFADITRLVEGAGLPERVVRGAVASFRVLAEAEGTVHGRAPEDVTFHEVGAVDSIADIVGSCVALDLLGARSVSCGPLPMGTGVVSSAHGLLPVPAPATLEVLKGSQVRWTGEPHETTTPTGAALMASLTGGEFSDAAPPMTLGSVGYGAGSIVLQHAPNILRAVVGELEGAAGRVELVEANVDDAPGELLGAAVEKLLASGALDAWLEPVTMKEGRGAYKVCALTRETDREGLARLLMRETGTLGVRHLRVGRTVAERRLVAVDLPYGLCRVKVGSLDGEEFVVAPEHEDAARLSRKTGLPLLKVYDDVRATFANRGLEENGG